MKKLYLKKRIRNAISAFHPGEVNYKLAIGEFSKFNVAYRDGTADESVIAHSFENDIFFSGVPEYVPGPEDVLIDVGAHIGTFSLLAASKAFNGRVYAVEASRETFNYLRVNAALNPALPISIYNLALTDFDGEVTLHHDRGNWGHSIMKPLSPRGERVAASSLATFVRDNGIDNVAFMKFNCEGAEFPILMSAPDELLQRVNMMLVLYHLDLVEGYTLEGLIDRLHRVGFSTEVRQKRSSRGWLIAKR